MRTNQPESDRVRVDTFYRFVPIEDPTALRAWIHELASTAGVLGTVLVAEEGINGTLSGEPTRVERVIAGLRTDPRFQDLAPRSSEATEDPFHRLKVRLKREIVTLGVPDANPNVQVGTYVDPSDWNALITDPEVTVIDVRNDYEVGIGSFEGALDPGLIRFSDFDAWVDAHPELAGRPIAMFCTGGMRCEKASSLMLHRGASQVFHLRGGILRYLEEIPVAESRWQGTCFVFDERVSVGHGLLTADDELCRGCRRPLTREARAHAAFEAGVRCGACPVVPDEVLAARRERARQALLATQRGTKHVGARRPVE